MHNKKLFHVQRDKLSALPAIERGTSIDDIDKLLEKWSRRTKREDAGLKKLLDRVHKVQEDVRTLRDGVSRLLRTPR